MAADHVFEFTFIRGDADGNGAVNLGDFNTLAANFGRTGRTFGQGNFDYDPAGDVTLADFNLLAARFGVSVAPQRAIVRSEFTPGDDELFELLA
jgi:hypothetical protein